MKLNTSFLPVNSVKNQFRCPMIKMQVVTSYVLVEYVFLN